MVALCGSLALTGQAEAQNKASKAKKVAKAVGPTVAVLYFDYSGKDDELSFLRKGLTQMLVTDLSQSRKLKLVERTELEAVLKELKLNRTKKIDRSSANRVGKLLGAQYLVTGGYFEAGGKLRVDARVIEVETGTVNGVGVHNDSSNFMQIESELATQLEGELLALHTAKPVKRRTAKNRRKRNKKKQRKVKASTVARYGKALDALDQGQKEVAMKELEAISDDFKPAAVDLKVLLR
jgi:TolB-like protein